LTVRVRRRRQHHGPAILTAGQGRRNRSARELAE
jgi:hypothetical protein